MVVSCRVVVRGRVQGVGFRWSCARRAESLGLHGWVANRRDGSVEAVVEGAPDAVQRWVEWAREGPAGTIVSGVDVADREPAGLRGFRIAPDLR